MGSAAGGPAGRAILSHWSVMVDKTSQIFAAGPAVVQRSLGQKVTKEELGGPEIAAAKAGTIDNVASSEDECFAMIRRFLGYMRSEEHTSELQSLMRNSYAVLCLNKKNKTKSHQ